LRPLAVIVYVPPRGPTWQVCPPIWLLRLAIAVRGVLGVYNGWGDVVAARFAAADELLPQTPFAARRHSSRLPAGSMALHASSRIGGVCAQAGPMAASATKTMESFMVVLLGIAGFDLSGAPAQILSRFALAPVRHFQMR
jgi:hypothetical protein